MDKERIPFIITIDTEGDNLWAKPTKITTKNACYLPRFQELCEKYSLKPVYLTNWEMVNDHFFQEFGKDIIKRDAGEIGMHLHAWNSPPYYKLTKDDFYYQPFLIEYPKNIMDKKIDFLTKMLEDTFNVSIVSHRAGRWAINNTYINLLKKHNYKIDCSITPYINWGGSDYQYKANKIDYSYFPSSSYFINSENIYQKGDTSSLLEVPVSIIRRENNLLNNLTYFMKNRFTKKILNYISPEIIWMRPDKNSIYYQIQILKNALINQTTHIEFILHSSELMPNCNPHFKNETEIEVLYEKMDILFSAAQIKSTGMSLNEYYDSVTANYKNNY